MDDGLFKMTSRSLKFLVKHYRPFRGAASLWVYGALALGVAATVMLFRFSARIEQTVQSDAKKFLASDYQIQSRRKFSQEAFDAALLIAKKEKSHVIRQTDLIASAGLKKSGEVLTVSLRALDGFLYPFYGTLSVEPASASVQSLDLDTQQKFGILVDASLKERGLSLGDEITLGKATAIIKGFILEEPQSVASAFALGPRVIVHQNMLEATGLTDFGAYAFYTLLIKSDYRLTEAQKILKLKSSEPHLRLISPERANQQTQRVVSRLQGFLLLIAFAALVLGAVGLFAISRFQVVRNLSDWILFKSLGVSKSELLKFSVYWVVKVSMISLVLGFVLGAALESFIANYVSSSLGIKVSEISIFSSITYAILISFGAGFFALGMPLYSVLQISPNKAWSATKAKSLETSSQATVTGFVIFTLGLVTLVYLEILQSTWLLSLVWMASISAVAFIVRALSQKAGAKSKSISEGYPFLMVFRSWSEIKVLVYAISSAIYLALLVGVVGATLRSQLMLGQGASSPSAVALGVLDDQKDQIVLPPNQKVTWTPTMQLRVLEIGGKAVEMAEFDDNGVRSEESDPSRSGFSLTREYIVSPREYLEQNELVTESLSKDSHQGMFSSEVSEDASIRVSVEQNLAKRLNIKLGDKLKVSIAGVEIGARVDSFRKVQWFRFQPSFLIVIHPGDVQGAPISYVGLFEQVDDLRMLQKNLQTQFPNIAVIDARSIAQKVSTIIDQVIAAVTFLGAFVAVASVWVFVAVVVSRRQAFRHDMYLVRILGMSARALREMSLRHFVWVSVSAGLVSGLLALLTAWLVCATFLETSLYLPAVWGGLLLCVLAVAVFALCGYVISGPYSKWGDEVKSRFWHSQ